MRYLLYALFVGCMTLVVVGVLIVIGGGHASEPGLDAQSSQKAPEARSKKSESPVHGGSEPCQTDCGRQGGFLGNVQRPPLNPEKTRPSEEYQAMCLFFGPLSQVSEKTNVFLSAPLNSINVQGTATPAKLDDGILRTKLEVQQVTAAQGKADDDKLPKPPEVQQVTATQGKADDDKLPKLPEVQQPTAAQEKADDDKLPKLPEVQQPTATQDKADDDKLPKLPEVQQPTAAQGKGDDDKLRKQLEVTQKQVQILEKMVKLLADEMKKAPPVGPAVEKLQTQTALLEARQQQAAVRDQDVANAIDDLRETADAERRNWLELPATLKELFHPERNNETPFGCWGTVSANYQNFGNSNSQFGIDWLPHFYLLLNEQFMLEVNPDITAQSIDLFSCQLDWCITDNLCLEIGRWYAPIGFFNDRLHTSWVFKTPDRPLMFSQVLPEQLNMNGIMARGAAYPTSLPVKLEYAAFVANGFSLAATNPTAQDFADLSKMKDAATRVNDGKAVGGRWGLNFPTLGWTVGISGLANGPYDSNRKFDLNLWDFDIGYHYGNWDFRFEYANTAQQAPVTTIRRQGFYAQLSYRPFDLPPGFLQKLEGVFRYDNVRFSGIDLAQTGINFASREAIPVDRNRFTFGLNYYLYESLILKFDWEINQELSFRSLNDNGFFFQMAWGY
jgi:hypothetical protein